MRSFFTSQNKRRQIYAHERMISSAATFNFSNLTGSISTLPGTPGAPGEPGKPGRQGLSGLFPALPRDGLSLLLARSGTCEHEDETLSRI